MQGPRLQTGVQARFFFLHFTKSFFKIIVLRIVSGTRLRHYGRLSAGVFGEIALLTGKTTILPEPANSANEKIVIAHSVWLP